MAITFTPGLAALSPEAKAAEYNTLINSGATDAQIKAAADAAFGAQSAEDWSYLTNLASQIAPAAAAPVTVEDLYQQYAGKTGDPEGLAFWKAGFGSDIGPEEVASFRQSVAAVNATPAASGALQQATQVAQPVTDFSGAAQDVVAATLTPQAIAWQQQQAASNALAEEQYAEQQRAAAEAAAAWAAGQGVDDTSRFFQETFGSTPTQEIAADLRSTYGSDLDEEERKQIILSQRDANVGYGGQSLDATSSGVVDRLTSQILNQGTTSQWGGEGYGSAQKTAADMALLLAAAGISDISQFGVRDKTVTTEDRYNEQGGIEQAGTTFTQPEYYNKATGQVINPYYDKASGNTWSGTFAGEGSTAYKVQFQPDGTPIFYSQYGGSSNDLAQVLDDPLIGAIVQTAAATFGGPLGTAALNLAMGKDIDDVAKAALTSYVAGQVASGVSGSTDVVNTLGQTGANVAGNVAAATVTGGNPVQALITGGVGAAMPEITAQIPGYGDLSLEQKAFVNSAISSTLRDGNLSPQDLVNAAFAAGNAAKKEITTGGITNRVVDDTALDAGARAFVDAKAAGATDEDAYSAAQAASGVVVTSVSDAGAGNVVTTTAGGVDTEFGDLAGAIEKNTMDDLVRADKLDLISQAPKFSDAYSQARELLGAGKTFTWNGKEYSTDTRNENQSLAAASDAERLNSIAASTTAGGGRGSAGSYANYDVKAAADNYSKTKVVPTTGGDYWSDETVYDPSTGVAISGSNVTADPNTVLGRAVIAANDALGGVVQTGLSNLAQAGGEQLAAFGGALAAIGATDADNMLVKAGKAAQSLGEQIETEESKQGTKSIVSAVSNAEGIGGKLIAGIKAMAENPAAAINLITKEGLQEILPAGAALRASKIVSLAAAAGLDTALNAAESMGSAYNDTYAAGIAKGMTKEAADALATSVALSAGGITLVTSGIADAALIKTVFREGKGGVTSQLTKGATKEGISENVEETATALATQYLTTGSINLDSALTQGAIGHLVGKSTAGSVGAVDVAAQTEAINNNISTAVSSGDAASVNTAITNSVQDSLSSGASIEVAVGSTVESAIKNGVSANESISSVVSSAVESGSDVDQVVSSAVDSAVNAGVSSTEAINSTVSSAITSGADSSQVIQSAITAAAGTGSASSAVVSSAVGAAISAGTDSASSINSAVTAAANTGSNISDVVGSAVSSAITAGADAVVAVDSAVTTAISTGANVDSSIASSVSSAIASGANAETVIQAAVDAAVNAGNDVTVVSNASTTTITNATTNTQTTVNASTGVTTTVDGNTNVTTTVDANTNTTTSVDANTNTTAQTTVDANTQTTTTVDANSNVTTQSVVDANTNTITTTTVDGSANTTTQTTIDANNNTQTTVVTDVNTGTQTTIKVNTDTGEILDEVETDIPDGWTPPVIAEPVVPSVVTPTSTTTTPTTTPTTPTAKAALPSAAGAGMLAGAAAGTLPFDWSPSSGSLRSKVTGEAIDPLARVKEAQAELERDAMMQNVDPRLMQILQQRMNPQQQSQQFEGDIGALSKLLGGGQESPSKDNYYSYGSEDSIDDILGGKAANYKEGGFVEPLKAEGGMVLPLLAKSGGALGHYKGREDFKGGKHVAGEGDGQSDDIPAWLADGEFVFSADVVAALGNGSTKAGTDKLYEMMHNIRERARSKGPKDLPPPALKSPLDYLKSSKRSTK